MLKFVRKEDVIKLFKELLPWDQEDIREYIGYDLNDMSHEDIIREFGINPLEFVDERDVVDCFGTSILDSYSDYDMLDEMDARLYRIDPDCIIDMLWNQFHGCRDAKLKFGEEDIERLEELVEQLKEAHGKTPDEVLGTTSVIRDDDGDVQDGTYESWLTFYNTEFNLPSDTKFKEGDKLEIYARKVNN